MNNESKTPASAGRIVMWAVLAVVCLGVVGTAFGLATDIFLILFLSVLFGVFLSRTSRLIDRLTPLSYPVSLGVVTTILLLLLVGGMAMFGAQIETQLTAARDQANAGVEKMRELANNYSTFRSVLKSTPFLRNVLKDNGGSHKHDSSDASADEGAESDKDATSDTKLAEQSAIRNTVEKGAVAIVGIFRTTFGLLINRR